MDIEKSHAKTKILLVDDDKELIEKLKLPLLLKEYDVFEAQDGLQALEIVRRETPDLIVLDILMPKLDGLKLTRLVKFDDRFSNIPVIAISHIIKVQDETLMKDIGVNLFLTKPVDPEMLALEVDKLLKTRKGTKK